MTVALIGIGADTTNCAPTPPVYSDGRFEYIPIPEAEKTTQNQTYGTIPLAHEDGVLADYLDRIWPGNGDTYYTGSELADWPLHHDPNFNVLTYGESASRAAYVSLLSTLEPGDIVAFYTGLQADDGPRHRYLIGYFTIDSVLDCRAINRAGETKSFSKFSMPVQEEIMEDHRKNAHAKRFFASGSIWKDDGLVILDGREPGGLLKRAIRISTHTGGAHHYLRETLQSRWNPEPSGNPERNAYLGGIKQAHRLQIAPDDFIDFIVSAPAGPKP